MWSETCATHNPEYWRAKAEEARAVADSMQSEQARTHMLSVAEIYDRLAQLAEKEPPHLLFATAANSQ